MKRFNYLTIAAMLICFFPASAMAAESLKIGIVDLQRCIKESKEGQEIFQQLKGIKEEKQAELDKKQEELLALKEQLEKQGTMLSLDARQDKQKEYERKKRELNYLYQDLSEEMKQEEAKARRKILGDLQQIVSKIGKDDDFFMIFEENSSGIMYYRKAIDITDQVIEAYDKSAQK